MHLLNEIAKPKMVNIFNLAAARKYQYLLGGLCCIVSISDVDVSVAMEIAIAFNTMHSMPLEHNRPNK